VSGLRGHRLCDIDHGTATEPHCIWCEERWPCEVARLGDDVRRLLETISALQTARSEAERRREAERVEADRLAAERDTIRGLYERQAAELADAREDLRNTAIAWHGSVDLVERSSGGERLRR
jgi:hypothetical protein